MKRSLIMFLAITFTFVFAWMYMQLFIRNTALSAGGEGGVVYYLQVGVFSRYENAMRRIEELRVDDIEARYYEKNEQFFVVTGMSMDVDEKEKVKQRLLDEGYGSYDKEIYVQEVSDIDQLLEVMRVSK